MIIVDILTWPKYYTSLFRQAAAKENNNIARPTTVFSRSREDVQLTVVEKKCLGTLQCMCILYTVS